MRFEPKSKAELKNLLPEGAYQAYVEKAEEKTSQAGNPMIVLNLEIYDAEGRKRSVVDRLILMTETMWKLLDFCMAAGLMEQYESGELTAGDCEGRSVWCKVKIKNDEKYGAKNEIKSYFVPKEAAPKRQPEGVSDKQRSAANKGKTEGEDCPF